MEVSLLYGTHKANCTERHRRKTFSHGKRERKRHSKEESPPGGRADRKVVLEYSSDETPDESAPRPAEGAEAPKRVKKQIHLTLPTSPAHVTTTETFTTFFINHGLTRALQKAFAKRGWSTDQMGEFVTNFQRKHGQQVPMPKIYRDEDTSDSDGIELADGTKAAKKTTGGAGGSGGSKPRKKPAAGGSAGTSSGGGGAREGGDGPSTSGGRQVLEARSEVVMTMVMMMTPTNAGRQGVKVNHQRSWWPGKNHARRAQLTPQLTGSCQSCTSLAPRRELCWAIASSTGLMSRRGRYTRRGCRGDR